MTKTLLLPAIALLPALGYVRTEDPSGIVALGAKGAVVMAPAELVASAYARNPVWTDDGTALLVERIVVDDVAPDLLFVARQRRDFQGVAALSRRRELVAWGVRSHRSRVVLAYDTGKMELSEPTPVPNGDRLLADLKETLVDPATGAATVRRSYALIAVGAGTLTRLTIADPSRESRVETSPQGRIAIVQHTAAYTRPAVAFLGADGRMGKLFPLPERSSFSFDESGRPVLYVLKAADATGRRRMEAHFFDAATGAVGAVVPRRPAPKPSGALAPAAGGTGAPPAAMADDEDAPEPPKEMRVQEVAMSPKSRGVVLVLAPGRMGDAGIVTADGTNPVLSPKNDAVAYLSGGSAFVRTFTRLSSQQYAIAAALAEREQLVDRGRMIGLGLALYAGDADDVMPPNGADVKDTVQPYVKNRNVFDGFVYTFGGALPESGRDKVEVGYIPGTGGQVVVYGDGSARWVPGG